jgi:hypothetical protein
MGLLLLLAALGGACSRSGEASTESVGTISRVQGSVDLVRDGETTAAAADSDLLAGDELRVDGTGVVNFDLGKGGAYELVRGSALLHRSGAVRLTDGILMIRSDEPLNADLEALGVAFDRGTVRVELPGPGRVAAYEVENLTVTSGAQEVPLPQLWQLSVLEDGRVDQARPLQFSRDDALDAGELAHALDADGKLGNLLRGLEPQLAATNGVVLTQRINAAGVSPESLGRFSTANRSDQLMGLAFAREWKKDVPAEMVQGFEQALALKVLGATWGLVAQNFGVNADALVASMQSEVTAVLFPNGTQIDPLVPRPSPAAAPRPAPQPPRGTSPAPPPPGPPAPAGTAAPSPTPPGLVGPVLDPLRPLLPAELEAIVDELYGLVHGLVPIV